MSKSTSTKTRRDESEWGRPEEYGDSKRYHSKNKKDRRENDKRKANEHTSHCRTGHLARFSLALVFSIFAITATATEGVGVTPRIPTGAVVDAVAPLTGRTVPAWALAFFVGEADESETAFLGRMGAFMAAQSRRTQTETCATVWRDRDGRRFAQVMTNRGHTTCVLMTTPPIDGDVTIETAFVHSHPTRGAIRTDRTDEKLTGVPEGTHLILDNDTFSAPDRRAGPGWLVADGALQRLDATGAVTRFPLAQALLLDGVRMQRRIGAVAKVFEMDTDRSTGGAP